MLTASCILVVARKNKLSILLFHDQNLFQVSIYNSCVMKSVLIFVTDPQKFDSNHKDISL